MRELGIGLVCIALAMITCAALLCYAILATSDAHWAWAIVPILVLLGASTKIPDE